MQARELLDQIACAWERLHAGAIERETFEALLAEAEQDVHRSVQNAAQGYRRKLEKESQERSRIRALWQYERAARQRGFCRIAGTDEVGRGPLAGPVVAAAVILPEDAWLPGIRDSKKLRAAQRERLDGMIRQQALCWALAEVDEKTIDAVNILQASRMAMQRAVEQLEIQPDFVLIDGLPNPRIHRPAQAIVGGDDKSISIAAASILAKVFRDHRMEAYDKLYPVYGFAANKGYPTAEHLRALEEYGPCPIHRRSFRPLDGGSPSAGR